MPTWTACSARSTWLPTRPSETVRTLVTGGGGFAGLHLLRELAASGSHEVTATYIGEAPAGDRLGPELARVEWLPMDLTDPASVEDVVSRVRPRYVYHLAGQASVGSSFGAPLVTWEVNATGTVRLLEALRASAGHSVRLLLVSSAEVYGAVPVHDQPIAEDRAYAPLNPYGVSKAAAEIAAHQAGRAPGLEIVVARSFNHIGPGQDERFVMASMAKQLAAFGRVPPGEREIRVGNLEVERDFLDVRDVARAYRVLMVSGAAAETYNVCSGRAVSLREVVERMVAASGTGARLTVDPARVRPADTPTLSGDNRRLRALGWAPEFELEETLSDLLGAARAAAGEGGGRGLGGGGGRAGDAGARGE